MSEKLKTQHLSRKAMLYCSVNKDPSSWQDRPQSPSGLPYLGHHCPAPAT